MAVAVKGVSISIMTARCLVFLVNSVRIGKAMARLLNLMKHKVDIECHHKPRAV